MFEPTFLPLLPGLLSDFSTVPLPSTTSISGLRSGFLPFPVAPPPASLKKNWREIAKEDRRERKRRRIGTPNVNHGVVGAPVIASLNAPTALVVVREMRRADVEGVKILQGSTLPLRYPPIFYTHLLTSSDHLCLLAFTSSSPSPSTPTACISARLLEAPNAYDPIHPVIYISSLAVATYARKEGLGRMLVKELVKRLGPGAMLVLHVQASNEGARRFYARLGLREVGKQFGYYKSLGAGDGGDGIEMAGFLSLV